MAITYRRFSVKIFYIGYVVSNGSFIIIRDVKIEKIPMKPFMRCSFESVNINIYCLLLRGCKLLRQWTNCVE